jgi:hypothetical protein
MTAMTAAHGVPESGDEHGHVPDTHGNSAVVAGPHGATEDHGVDHGHDDHGHAPGALGPIDWRMWIVGAAGLVVGVIVAAGFVVATNFSFSA